MAKVVLDLNKFKASGVYTLEFDASESITITNQTIRLVVGFSRKGPFNRPVFLKDQREAKKIFGPIDSFLEKRGSFFHRSLETCLRTAPVFALALLPLNNMPVNQGGDSTEYRAFSLDSSKSNGEKRKALVSSFFDQERFWFPSQSYLQATVDSKIADRGKLFSFVNIGQEPQSIIIRKSVNANKYNITAQEYYENNKIPPYINKYDYMSDYFVDVYIIKGDWTNLQELSQNPLYAKYFDLRGLKIDQLDNFLSLDSVVLTGAFTGTIIPDFLDNNNVNQSIDRIINNASPLTGIFCTINKDALDEDDYVNSIHKVDMIGNNLIGSEQDSIEFLSYSTPIKSVLKYSETNHSLNPLPGKTYTLSGGEVVLDSKPLGGEYGKFFNILKIKKPSPVAIGFTIYDYEEIRDNIKIGSRIKCAGSVQNLINDYLKVYDIIDTGDSLNLVLGSDMKINPAYEAYIDTSSGFIGGPMSKIVIEGIKFMGNVVPTGNTFNITLPNSLQLAEVGDTILIEYPGYSKYFRIENVGTSLSAPNFQVTIDSSPAAPVGPYYLDNFIDYGIATDEFGINPNPNDFKITIFKSSATTTNSQLIPDTTNLKIDFDYKIVKEGIPAIDLGLLGLRTTNGGIVNNNYRTCNWVKIEKLDNTEVLPTTAGNYFVVNNYNFSSTPNFEIHEADNISSSVEASLYSSIISGTICKFTLSSGEIFYGEYIGTGAGTGGDFKFLTTGDLPDLRNLFVIEFSEFTKAAEDYRNSKFISGDKIKWGSLPAQINYLKLNTQKRTSNLFTYFNNSNSLVLKQFTDSSLLKRAKTNLAKLDFTYIDDDIYKISNTDTNSEIAILSSIAKNISETLELRAPGLLGSGKKFALNETNANKLQVGDYIVANNSEGNQYLVKVISKIAKFDTLLGEKYFEYEVLDFPAVTTISGNYFIEKYSSIQNFADRLLFTFLNGFSIKEYHLPGNNSQLSKILGVLENTNIGKALADKDIISYRYIVDTFNGGLEPQMGAKSILSRLAKNRQKCLALINMPSVKEFLNSTDPRFTELPQPEIGIPKPVLNVSYIATGGNLSLGPSFTFSLPDEENGAKYMGVFFPNMIIREDNTEKSIPLAADVSNNFIRKFILGEPYSIVAGTRRGVISNSKFVKMEYDFLLSDREYLEPMGVNTIVNIKNVGPTIYANQTAYQKTLSALNNLHVRDLLITLELGIEEITQNYLFEFNDVSTRQEIVSIVNTYLDGVRNAGGLRSFSVLMNDKNNTPELIGSNFGLLDVEVEPQYGIQKFINRFTIRKTGGALSGGFVAI